MFVRTKPSGAHKYLQVVESFREGRVAAGRRVLNGFHRQDAKDARAGPPAFLAFLASWR